MPRSSGTPEVIHFITNFQFPRSLLLLTDYITAAGSSPLTTYPFPSLEHLRSFTAALTYNNQITMRYNPLALPPLRMNNTRTRASSVTLPVIGFPAHPITTEARLRIEARNLPVRPEYVDPPAFPIIYNPVFSGIRGTTDQPDSATTSSYSSSSSHSSHQRTASSSTTFTESDCRMSPHSYETGYTQFCLQHGAVTSRTFNQPYTGAVFMNSEAPSCSPRGSTSFPVDDYDASASDSDSQDDHEVSTGRNLVFNSVHIEHGRPLEESTSGPGALRLAGCCTMPHMLDADADMSTHQPLSAAPIARSPRTSGYPTPTSESEYTPNPRRRKSRLAGKSVRHDPYLTGRSSRNQLSSPSSGISTYQSIIALQLEDGAEERVKTRARKQWNIKEYDFLDPIVAEWVAEHPGQDVIDMQPLWPKVMVEMEKKLGHARTWNGFLTVACKHYQHQTSRSVRVTKQKDRTEKALFRE
ncbi:hypothetical protein FRC02_007339 [Tulasnella sp. 418]|nr:hypothetical protein FRC02_007339 [Tulasnella sp. 418]